MQAIYCCILATAARPTCICSQLFPYSPLQTPASDLKVRSRFFCTTRSSARVLILALYIVDWLIDAIGTRARNDGMWCLGPSSASSFPESLTGWCCKRERLAGQVRVFVVELSQILEPDGKHSFAGAINKTLFQIYRVLLTLPLCLPMCLVGST